jgi:CRP-like cAMP-binding protein
MEGNTPLVLEYILRKGSMLISKIGSQGKEQVLNILHEEEIPDLKYTSSGKTTKESSVLFMPKEQS